MNISAPVGAAYTNFFIRILNEIVENGEKVLLISFHFRNLLLSFMNINAPVGAAYTNFFIRILNEIDEIGEKGFIYFISFHKLIVIIYEH